MEWSPLTRQYPHICAAWVEASYKKVHLIATSVMIFQVYIEITFVSHTTLLGGAQFIQILIYINQHMYTSKTIMLLSLVVQCYVLDVPFLSECFFHIATK